MIEAEEEEDLLLRLALHEQHKKQRRRWHVRPLNTTRAQQGEYSLLVRQMRDMDEERHFGYFRMSAARFDDLARRIMPYVQHAPTHRTPISVEEQLAVTLHILASGSSQNSVAANYKLGLSTVYSIVSEVTVAIWRALKDDFVAFPSPAQMVEIKNYFWTPWDLPNCVGAIDGKHM